MKQLPILFRHDDIQTLYPNIRGFYGFVSRGVKRGEIKQIKKGIYALVDRSTNEIYANRFQIASRLFDDAYFSYHEALDYYGLATQSFVSRFCYLTHVYVKDLEVGEVVFHAKKSECPLEIIDRMKEEGVRLVSLERAIVDSIDNPSLGGGLEEIEGALAHCPDLNVEAIEKLLAFYDKAFLYQKVGYLFEKHFGNRIPDSFYAHCLTKIGNKINYFEAKVGFSKLVLKWRLMVPQEGQNLDELLQELSE